jgi:hypothetical protein
VAGNTTTYRMRETTYRGGDMYKRTYVHSVGDRNNVLLRVVFEDGMYTYENGDGNRYELDRVVAEEIFGLYESASSNFELMNEGASGERDHALYEYLISENNVLKAVVIAGGAYALYRLVASAITALSQNRH